jgi:hypothetical protein
MLITFNRWVIMVTSLYGWTILRFFAISLIAYISAGVSLGRKARILLQALSNNIDIQYRCVYVGVYTRFLINKCEYF